MNNKGQTILAEYVMIFFVVVAAAVAMTTYLQRALEARINSAKDLAINSVMNSGACDSNCQQATGNIMYGYEPYYPLSGSFVQQNQNDSTGATQGNAQVIGAIYINSLNETTQSISASDQLPPCCDMNPVPGWCGSCNNSTL